MKLLLDQGLARTTASLLRQAGIDTVHTGEIGLSTAEDKTILDTARRDNRTIVTLDADFHSLLAQSGDRSPSVIRIRIERLRAEPMAKIILSILNQCAEELKSGAAVTVQVHRVRLRMLPLIKNP